jgi:hypothetical protein
VTRLTIALVLALVACSKKHAAPADDPPPPPAPLATVPPVAESGLAPTSAVLDASVPAGTPFEQAKAYADSGQYWLARLVLERKALGADGTKDEIELLSSLCERQSDAACVRECASRLGRKTDAGAPKRGRR